MSATTTTGNAYGIGIMTMIVAVSASVVFYQSFYLPESLEKPAVDEHILHPTSAQIIEMAIGSSSPEQQDYFVPQAVDIQLGTNNLVTWNNIDDTAHTVTPDEPFADSYSGDFGSNGVVRAGETFEFLFTEAREFSYHCEPHPWMTGTLSITKQRF